MDIETFLDVQAGLQPVSGNEAFPGEGFSEITPQTPRRRGLDGRPGPHALPTEPGAGTTGGAWIHDVATGSCSLGVASVCLPQACDSHVGGVGADALLLGKSLGRVPGVGGRRESSLNPSLGRS